MVDDLSTVDLESTVGGSSTIKPSIDNSEIWTADGPSIGGLIKYMAAAKDNIYKNNFLNKIKFII